LLRRIEQNAARIPGGHRRNWDITLSVCFLMRCTLAQGPGLTLSGFSFPPARPCWLLVFLREQGLLHSRVPVSTDSDLPGPSPTWPTPTSLVRGDQTSPRFLHKIPRMASLVTDQVPTHESTRSSTFEEITTSSLIFGRARPPVKDEYNVHFTIHLRIDRYGGCFFWQEYALDCGFRGDQKNEAILCATCSLHVPQCLVRKWSTF
jgi:hypothetical protein